ncbi:Retrovirus-related Pol polyprotein from transposon opus [Labeo rohita]|uniref:Gypsy retrotransposon integrase-like protein 1 n=1 Tax=Labeo rohita TaxID=84645 RepID=A0ABQ8L5V1_LABRO|nr:Retrovirus-related Pol polyprotein from transposon opus [Labeo rohita]
MAKFSPPESFDFSHPELWPEWKQRFHRFRIATKLDKESGEVQVCTLLYSLRKEAEHIVSTFVYTAEGDENRYDIVLDKLDNYFVPKVNVIHERARFHQRVQKQGESVEEFIRSLHELAETCAFGEVKGENIRDRLVIGVLDKDLSQRLQMMSDLSLERACRHARQSEQIKSHVSEQSGTSALNEVVRTKHSTSFRPKGAFRPDRMEGKRMQKPNNQRYSHSNDSAMGKCMRCGKQHPTTANCPARRAECRKCGKRGHYAIVCRTLHVSDVKVVHEQHEDSFFLGAITVKDSNDSWTVTLRIQDTDVQFKIDTGADISVISEQTYEALNMKPDLTSANTVLDCPGGKLRSAGRFETSTHYRGNKYCFTVFVITGQSVSNLLSREASAALGLVQRIDNVAHSPSASVGLLKTIPVRIKLKADAVPYAVTTARRVSVPLLPKVKAELERMVKGGVIEEITEPTEWCAPMVPVPRKSGQVRICVGLNRLNQAVERERYILPTLDDILPQMAGATMFSLLDAESGFWQIPLERESAKLTTFITPFGRYFFHRLPFGISSAPEIFQREMNNLLRDHEGTAAYMDDIIVYGETQEVHDRRLQRVLKTLSDAGLKLNEDKCLLRQTQLRFLGHVIDSHGVRPDKEKVAAIMNVLPPQNVTEVKRILGMVHYLGRYIPGLAEITRPLNDLLKAGTAWTWSHAQEQALIRIKQLLSEAPVLSFFDMNKPTIVSADASSYGLGGVLFQQQDGCLRPIAYCSRTLTDTEARYAQIEKECLSVVWACEKFSKYLYGLDSFVIHTDHKPLIPLINSKEIDMVPLRCQRLLIRLMKFNAKAEFVPGKLLVVADTLSRHPSPTPQLGSVELTDDITALEESTRAAWPMSRSRLREVVESTQADSELQVVMRYVKQGWPKYPSQLPEYVKPYYAVRDMLSVCHDLLIYSDRIIIPSSMRAEVKRKIHEGHMGITKCRERAKQSVWWPGISKEIQVFTENCTYCQTQKPAQRREPLMTTPLPEAPWVRIAADICEVSKRNYLVVVDYFSRFIDIAYLPDMLGKTVTLRLSNMFARWGCPDTFVTDNGPQFSGQHFQNFAKAYGFRHVTTSPYFPQSNGEAERAVRTAKHILKQEDPFLALLAYRVTPIQATGYSPAQLMLGRQLRTPVPVLEKKLTPNWPDFSRVRASDNKAKSNYKLYYDRRHGCRPLPELKPGDPVVVKTDSEKGWNKTATVVHEHNTPRSYIVRTEDGNLRRNRKHLRFFSSSSHRQAFEEKRSGDQEQTQSEQQQDVQVQNKEQDVSEQSKNVVTSRGRVIKQPGYLKDFIVST